MNINPIAFATLIVSAVVSPACTGTLDCTEIGCANGYTLFLEAPGTAFTAGNYSVTVTFDGELADDCTVLISDNDVECGTTPCILQNTCDTVDGVDNQLKELQITTAKWEGALPSTVVLSLARDGQGLAERTFEPDYEETYPNGEECDDEPCRTAEDRLTLPS